LTNILKNCEFGLVTSIPSAECRAGCGCNNYQQRGAAGLVARGRTPTSAWRRQYFGMMAHAHVVPATPKGAAGLRPAFFTVEIDASSDACR
jgi:hypothetical protein